MCEMPFGRQNDAGRRGRCRVFGFLVVLAMGRPRDLTCTTPVGLSSRCLQPHWAGVSILITIPLESEKDCLQPHSRYNHVAYNSIGIVTNLRTPPCRSYHLAYNTIGVVGTVLATPMLLLA